MRNKIINFHGINFHDYDYQNIIKEINKGGYLVAPAASALYSIKKNHKYLNALQKSRISIFDSGYFCILLRLFRNIKVKKNSGYLFLKTFLNDMTIKNKKIYLVDPSFEDSKFNKNYLLSKKIYNIKSYVAPLYGNKIEDFKLLQEINFFRPDYIIINIGGEIQEILALFLINNLKKKTSIFCTGAAIAFLTKRQAPINDYIDKFYLGWLVRLIYNPRVYFSRVLKSIKLIKFFL